MQELRSSNEVLSHFQFGSRWAKTDKMPDLLYFPAHPRDPWKSESNGRRLGSALDLVPLWPLGIGSPYLFLACGL